MTQTSESKPASLITPKQIFVAYAEMQGTRDSFPKTKGYYEKRWRLISSLFEIHDEMEVIALTAQSPLLNGLSTRWVGSANYYPLSTPLIGRHPEPDFSIAAAHKGSLARKAVSMRSEYEEMGGELILALFPQIKERNVSTGRLLELGLPLKAPNPDVECLEYIEQNIDKDDEEIIDKSPCDNVPKRLVDELKRSEEVRARAEAALAIDVAAVRRLALEQGIASEEQIDRALYEMALPEFLKLAGDYPKVSRTHFNPDLKTYTK